MFILGLTGPIASGKSTVANLLKQQGTLILNADDIVHTLYKANSEENVYLQKLVGPNILTQDGDIDRKILMAEIKKKPDLLKKIEAYIHPQVRRFYKKEIEKSTHKYEITVIEAPLMFEGNLAELCDKIVVCTCDLYHREQRALQREGMTQDKFNMIIQKQMTMSDYEDHADYLINTGISLTETEHEIIDLMEKIRGELPSAWPTKWSNI